MLKHMIALINLAIVVRSNDWIHEPLSVFTRPLSTSHVFASLNFSKSAHVLCPLDRIELEYATWQQAPLHLMVWEVGSEIAQLRALVDARYRSDTRDYEGVISPAVNGLHLPPSIESVAVSEEKQTLTIRFNADVISPDFFTAKALMDAFTFYPELTGAAVGEWIDPKTLLVHCDKEYIRSILTSHYNGHSISINLRNTANEKVISGLLSLRVQEHGEMMACLVDREKFVIVSNIVQLSVESSCSTIVLPSRPEVAKSTIDSAAMPATIARVRGILALSGSRGLSLSSETLPKSGSYSISFWIKLMEEPTGKFRTLFYKGNGLSGVRTPSAWLMPKSNGIAARVSTNVSDDVGASTIQSTLPVKRWIFLSFTFMNNNSSTAESMSKEGQPDLELTSKCVTVLNAKGEVVAAQATPKPDPSDDNRRFIYSVYINGELDIAMYISDDVFFSDSPLTLFNEISHDGPRSFVQDVAVWDGVLESSMVRDLYRAGRYSQASASANVATTTESIIRHSELLVEFLSASSPDIVQASRSAGEKEDTDVATVILSRAQEHRRECSASVEERLDMYAEAAIAGSVEALYFWGSVLVFGSESPTCSCGVPQSTSPMEGLVSRSAFDSLTRGAHALLVAAHLGHSDALLPLATLVQRRLGLQDYSYMCAVALDIPVPAGFIDSACQPSPSQSLVKYVLDALDSSDYPDIFVENNSSSENPSALEIFSSGLLHAAAILGIDGAYQSLGYRYSSGVGVTVDDETAAFYYNAAVGTASQHFHVVGGQPIVESDRIDDHTAKSVVIGNAGGDDELIQHQILRADEGHIPSALASADLYYYGARGLPRDQQRALTYYRMAAEKGDLQGLCGAANMYLKGEGTVDGEKNTTEAIRLYELAVEGGSVSAMNGLGYVYFYGQGVPKNETKAFYLFLAAAEMEIDSDSLFNAGHCLQYGIGIPSDSTRALRLYTIAARKFGHFDSISRLGIMHHHGIGVERSATSALTYLKVAAGIGPWASWLRRALDQYMLGYKPRTMDMVKEVTSSARAVVSSVLSLGTGKDGDDARLSSKHAALSSPESHHLTKSLVTYIYAADFGFEIAHSNAAYLLSRRGADLTSSLSDEKSHRSNIEEALLRSSTRLGSVNSMVQTGDLYFRQARAISDNSDVARRNSLFCAAMWWYTKASSRGHPLGSYYAGIMLQFGIGSEKNLLRAVRYYDLALVQGGQESVSEGDAARGDSIRWVMAAAARNRATDLPGNSIASQSSYTQSSTFWSILRFLKWVAIYDPIYADKNANLDGWISMKLLHSPFKLIAERLFA